MTEAVKEVVSVSFGKHTATIDKELFQARVKWAMGELDAEDKAKKAAKESATNFKETVEGMAITFKLPKPELAKYLKARWDDIQPKEEDDKLSGTEVTIERGNLYTILNDSLEG
jgi:hypothetical protein